MGVVVVGWLVGGWVGGFVGRKESWMRGGGGYSYRNSHLPTSVFKSKQLRLSQKKCRAFFRELLLKVRGF